MIRMAQGQQSEMAFKEKQLSQQDRLQSRGMDIEEQANQLAHIARLTDLGLKKEAQDALKEYRLAQIDLSREGLKIQEKNVDSMIQSREDQTKLSTAEITQKIMEFEYKKRHDKTLTDLDQQKIDHAVNQLKSLDAYRENTLAAENLRHADNVEVQNKLIELKHRGMDFDEVQLNSINYWKGMDHDIAQRKTHILERQMEIEQALADAKYNQNQALTRKYTQEAERLKTTNEIINQYLSGKGSDLGSQIAREALGLKDDTLSPSEIRLRAKELTNTKLKAIENKNDEMAANVYLKKIWEDEPDSTQMWYWDTVRKNEVKMVPLPKNKEGVQITAKNVLAYAETEGITVEEALRKAGVIK